MGYHDKEITPGLYGETSKIREEVEEMLDFEQQKPPNPLGMLIEMSDIIGAIDGYLERHHPTIKLADLVSMAKRTKSAFKEGRR